MENSLFKKFDYYWFFLIFTVILSFGFYLSHPSMGIDDEILHDWVIPYPMLNQNRIGNVIFGFLQIWDYFPFWKEFLAIVAYSAGITLYAENFINYLNFENFKFDKKMATIFSCIAVSFPFFAISLMYMEICFINGLNIIAGALALRSLYKYINGEKKKYLLLCFLLIFFIISCYETGVLFFIISVCFIEFISFIFNNKHIIKKSYKTLSVALFLSILSIILTHSISFISRLILKLPYSRYKEYVGHNFSSFGDFFTSLINTILTFIQNFIQTCSNNAGSIITLISYVIFLLIILSYSFKRKNIHIFLYGTLIMLIPFTILILTGNANIYYRNYSALGFINAFSALLIYFIFRENKILTKFTLFFVFVIVFYQSLEINKMFYTEYLKFENDRLFAYSLKQEVDKLGGKPLLLVGTRENPKLKYEYYIEAPEINISVFNWDRYQKRMELFVNRPYNFMKEQGFEVRQYTKEIMLDSKEKFENFLSKVTDETQNMPIYPMEGSVKDCDDFILIKIGKSLFDEQKEEELK